MIIHSACEDNWDLEAIGNKTYCFINAGKSTWANGIRLCQMYNSKLPLPKNAQEDADFYSYLNKINLLSSWLDGTDEDTEGIWLDSAGNNITFFNWRGDQPDNNHGQEHFLHYRPGWGGKWNDHWGTNVEHIVCQKDPIGE